MSEQAQPIFNIEKLYVRDLSLEVPNAPKIFLERETPQINVQLRTEANTIEDGIYDIALTVTATAKLPDERTLFMVEVVQAGIFQIRNIPQQELEPVMMIGCPNILFPYAREAVSDAVTRAGFQPVLLAPVNFEALYNAQKQQQAQQGANGANGEAPSLQ